MSSISVGFALKKVENPILSYENKNATGARISQIGLACKNIGLQGA